MATKIAPSASQPAPRQPSASRAPRGISRTDVNFVLDTLLLVVFSGLVFVAAVLRFVFPAGTQAAGWTLWGGNYDDWSDAQFALLGTFSLGILVHLMLHWSWVCGVVSARLTRRLGRTVRIDESSQTVYGVGLLIGLLNLIGLAIAAAALSVHAP